MPFRRMRAVQNKIKSKRVIQRSEIQDELVYKRRAFSDT